MAPLCKLDTHRHADVYMLTNGNEIIKFVDDAQLRIKSLSASVYVDPHKVSLIDVFIS